MSNQFIKWTSTDEQGEFSHVGAWLYNDNGFVHLLLNDGSELVFPMDDGTMKEVTKPANWGQIEATPDAPVEKKAKRDAKPGSKKAQALIIVRDVFGRGHGKDITIQRLKDVLNMSDAGAQTYFYNAKRELAL